MAYWLPEREEYVDREGHPVTLPAQDAGSVATEITHQGRRVGALVHDGTLSEDSELMRAVAGAAGLALENERLEVELRARLQALRASRARIVAVGDAERRRLGRDLHDGAQQRLISLLLDLQLARERWEDDPELARARRPRAESARAAVEELRDLASGIHPAVLSQRGTRRRARVAGHAAPRCPSSSTWCSTSACPPRPRRRRTSWSPRR